MPKKKEDSKMNGLFVKSKIYYIDLFLDTSMEYFLSLVVESAK